MAGIVLNGGTVKTTGGATLRFVTLAQNGSPSYNGFTLDLGISLGLLDGDVTVKDLTVSYTGTAKRRPIMIVFR